MAYLPFSSKVNGVNTIFAADVNNLQTAISDLSYNVKGYGALGDGSTDDTTAIAAAIAAASAAGGGVVFFPEGTYLTNKFTLPSLVSLKGAGAGASIIKLNTTQNTALLTTTGFVTTDTAGGIHSFTIEALTFDGNKANQTSNSDSGCVQIYGYNYILRNVRIKNAETIGLYTNYESGVLSPGPDSLSMEAYVYGLEVWGCLTTGIHWNGPHDSVWYGVFPHENGTGVYVGARGNGLLAFGCHSWGVGQTYAWNIEGTGVNLIGCIGEGAGDQLRIAANDCVVMGGHYFKAGAGTQNGIIIAGASGGHRIDTKVSNTTTSAIAFTSDGGNNVIDLNVYSTTGAIRSGTQHADTILRAFGNGGVSGGHSLRTVQLGPWAAENLGTSITDAWLTFDGQGVVGELPMLRAGSLTGVILRSNAARTAGTLAVTVRHNGSATALVATLDATNTSFHVALAGVGTIPFAIGDTIGITVTTDASWAPTTADHSILVEVVY